MARDVHKVLLQIIVKQGRTTQDEAELLLKGDVWVTWPGASAKEWGHQVLGNCAIRDTVKYIELYLIDLFFLYVHEYTCWFTSKKISVILFQIYFIFMVLNTSIIEML